MSELVSPAEAHERMGRGWAYLDVRTEEEFREGHPEGAWNVPLGFASPWGGMEPNPDFLAAVRALFPPGAPLVLG